jgi:hypothetical protein
MVGERLTYEYPKSAIDAVLTSFLAGSAMLGYLRRDTAVTTF